MYYYSCQVTLQRDTERLVTLAQNIDFSTIDILMAKENIYAWHRKINFFYRVTGEVENYLLYSSLPYCLSIGTDIKLMHIWPSFPFPMPGDSKYTKNLTSNPILPTGNIRPEYMIIGDSPTASPRHNKRLFNAGEQGYFDRAWSRGFAARVLRGALEELHLHTSTWYTNFLKLSTPKQHMATYEEAYAHYYLLENEINTLKPDNIILIGRNAANLAYKLHLIQFCEEKNIRVFYAKHPSLFKDSNCQFNAQKKYANHLYDILF